MTEKNSKPETNSVPQSQKKVQPVDVNDFINSLPEDKRELATQVIVSIAESRVFQGPLPAPEDFREYEAVLPGVTREIVDMAKSQQAHRMEIENKVTDHEIKQSNRGQLFGFILGCMCIIGALIAADMGVAKLAYLLGSTTLLGVLVVFVLNKLPWLSKDKEERK